MKTLTLAIYFILALPAAALSIAILLLAATGWGRWVGIAGLALALLPAALYLGATHHHPRAVWWGASLALGLLALGVTVGVLLNTPTGQARPGSPVSQGFTGGGRFERFTLSNIVPETEQVKLGLLVTPYIDRLFTRERSRRVSGFTLDLYHQMDADPDFRRLGSAMGGAYADFLGAPFDGGHYYLYVPRRYAGSNPPPEPLPALLFLHGSFGNFKTYTWVLSRLAEERGLVVIAPSFGFGDWRQAGGVEAAWRALEAAGQAVPIDPQQVWLAGLSNGGLGVSLLAGRQPAAFRGLIFISPVIADEAVSGSAFREGWAGRPVLVLTGEADERIPLAYVTGRVERMARAGVEVHYVTYPGEDHFLLFSQPDLVLAEISRWMDR